MSRTQIALLFIGCVGVAGILLFPVWSVSNAAGKVELGRSWILDPPARLGPEDFLDLDLSDEPTEEARQRLRAHIAASYGEPEINWVLQGYALVVLLTVCVSGVIAHRNRRPREARSRADAASPVV